jgi:hypothetical protein
LQFLPTDILNGSGSLILLDHLDRMGNSMKTRHDAERIKDLAYRIWEEQGRPDGRQEDHWAEAERRLSSEPEVIAANLSPTDGLSGGKSADGQAAQDTPGRPKAASSRQQTQPGQSTQTGSADLDAKGASSSPSRHR